MADIKESPKLVDSNKIYEIGYFIVSSIPEEKVLGEMETINLVITKNNGEIIASDTPKIKPLAYTMIKTTAGRNVRYNEGYFGWMKFEIQSSSIDLVKKELDSQENILRYLLINTVRESTLAPQKVLMDKEENKENSVSEDKKPISVEEIDMKIDAMVKEV
ncbi:MAG: 30S ribosomal protein S6 [Patescibacteria group bacterium]